MQEVVAVLGISKRGHGDRASADSKATQVVCTTLQCGTHRAKINM